MNENAGAEEEWMDRKGLSFSGRPARLNREASMQDGPLSNRQCGTTRRLLWIDDEAAVEDATVQLLQLEISNLHVDCADSGALGLRLALMQHYTGIILDLRLPDLDGLTMLERMRTAGLRPPVLMLSAWADAEAAAAAMRLGAADVRSKPLFGAELLDAVAALLNAADSPTEVHGALWPPSSRPQDRRTLLEAAHLLAQRTTYAVDFVALARAFRDAVARSPTYDGAGLSKQQSRDRHLLLHRMDRPLKRLARKSVTIDLLAQEMQADIAEGILRSAAETASRNNLTQSELKTILRESLGVSFRECRLALRVRPTMPEVAFGVDQMAQIAYRHGYNHPGQFDRDFLHVIGIQPRTFRTLCGRSSGPRLE